MPGEKPPVDESVMRELPPNFFEGLLPNTDESDSAGVGSRSVNPEQFLYLGQGLKADEFTAYAQSYDFGSQPPDFVVLHHTAIPGATYANSGGALWDASEDGMDEARIYQKRLNLMNGIKEYYRTQLGWDRGPHLFIDDRWIWLFTPMFHQGIHAAEGNGFHDGNRLHYSIGIEVVGDYTNVRWPQPVEILVGHAVAVLRQRLGTFELRCQRMSGGVSSHRDYNKPSCPGAAITNDYYIGVIQQGLERLQSGGPVAQAAPPPPTSPLTVDSPILAPPSGTLDQAVAYVRARLPAGSEYTNDVATILGYYWQYAPSVGVDPFIAACQCIFETDGLKSQWAARPRRNPAGLGVRQEGGLSFDTWENAVQAHLGQLLAFALKDEESSDAQRQMMGKNPRHGNIASELRGSARNLAGLSNHWTDDADYATRLVTRAKDVRGG